MLYPCHHYMSFDTLKAVQTYSSLLEVFPCPENPQSLLQLPFYNYPFCLCHDKVVQNTFKLLASMGDLIGVVHHHWDLFVIIPFCMVWQHIRWFWLSHAVHTICFLIRHSHTKIPIVRPNKPLLLPKHTCLTTKEQSLGIYHMQI